MHTLHPAPISAKTLGHDLEAPNAFDGRWVILRKPCLATDVLSTVFPFMCKGKQSGEVDGLDRCLFFFCVSDTGLCSDSCFLAKIPTDFHFIIERALRTAGALSPLLHKPLILPCFVSGKVTSAPCSRVSRTLKTMSPLITCLPSLNINTTCLEMSRRGAERKKAPFASKRQI